MTWTDVYRQLRADIGGDVLRKGADLPSQGALMARFGASRHAVRRALGALKAEGLIDSWQGKGARVGPARLAHRLTDRPRLRRDAARAGATLTTETASATIRRAPADIAALLGLGRAGGLVARSERVVRIDGQSVQIVRHYLDHDRFPGILPALERAGSLRDAMAALGVRDYTRGDIRMLARLPTQHELTLLQIPKSQPVVTLTFGSQAPDGVPVAVTQTVNRGDRMEWVIGPAVIGIAGDSGVDRPLPLG